MLNRIGHWLVFWGLFLTATLYGGEPDVNRLVLSPVFSEGMVLPHGVAIPVTGTAKPLSVVTVRFGAKTRQSRTDERGRWRVELPALPPSLQPEALDVRTETDTLRLKNILVGEVWLCAGQSNMLFELRHCDGGDKAAEAFEAAAVRFLKRSPRNGWQADGPFGGSWTQATATEAKNFSGAGGFFALHRAEAKPGVPIGLISVSYGGAPIESFLDRKDLADSPLNNIVAQDGPWYDHADYAPWCGQRARDEIKRLLQQRQQQQTDEKVLPEPEHLFGPGRIYETALADMAGFPLTGVLWYQGESNATTNLRPDVPLDAKHNEAAMRRLVEQFRRDFPKAAGRSKNLPFVMVQLPKMNRPWAEYRASQWKVAKELPDVVAVVTTDTGVPNDVHPRDKEPVGRRLAEAARRLVDGDRSAAVFPEAVEVRAHNGGFEIRFSPPGPLVLRGEEIAELELVDAEGKARPARGTLRQRGGETRLWVEPDGGTRPVEIRYNWVNVPRGNLYSERELPAAPFRLALP